MSSTDKDQTEITRWGYCYCHECNSIRYIRELKNENGILSCSVCGSTDLTPPGWVCCPQISNTSVNCPVAGMGIVTEKTRIYCNLHCSFRR